jgi:hypothetical protein
LRKNALGFESESDQEVNSLPTCFGTKRNSVELVNSECADQIEMVRIAKRVEVLATHLF